jgi:hypothetical protein
MIAAGGSRRSVVFVESADWHQSFIQWFLNIDLGAPEQLYGSHQRPAVRRV